MPAKYKCIGKKTKDLLSKLYDNDFVLQTVNKSKDGFTMTSGLTMENRSNLSGDTTMEYEDDIFNVEVNMNVNGEKEDENTTIKCTANQLTKGLDVSLGFNVCLDMTAEMTYVHDSFAINAKVLADAWRKKTSVSANGAFTFNNLAAGLNASFDLIKQEPDTIDIGLQYQQKPHTGSVLLKKLHKNSKQFDLGYHVTPKDDLSVAALVNIKEENAGDESTFVPKATLGVNYSVNPTTTLKAKVDTSKDFSYAIEQKLSNPPVKINFSHSMQSPCFTTKDWGFGLTFGNY